jgi:SAM-dependent methyltransferase
VSEVNVDPRVADGFGDEWTRFDQSGLDAETRRRIWDEYFSLMPWSELPARAEGADFGCGSGRWAALVAPRVGRLLCVDASGAALAVARRNLGVFDNVELIEASIDATPIPDGSLDFCYSLGVLHHVRDTAAGIRSCARKLKAGAPFLLYLYYRFDNRPTWFRALWKVSDVVRTGVSRLPHGARYAVSQVIAACVYWPLARLAALAKRAGLPGEVFPLHYYSDKPFYVMRTDALDRFGTRLEQRFTRVEIRRMMEDAGLHEVRSSDGMPYWCAIGVRRADASAGASF